MQDREKVIRVAYLVPEGIMQTSVESLSSGPCSLQYQPVWQDVPTGAVTAWQL